MQQPLNPDERKKLIALTRLAVTNFNAGDWHIVGVETGTETLIDNHPRLLRSLSFNDPDYSGVAHAVMSGIVERDRANLQVIEDYVTNAYGDPGENISTAPSNSRSVIFKPSVFELPAGGVERDLIAVMSPFAPQFEPVFEAIAGAASAAGFRAQRAKDIWQHTAVIQDVFSLIFRAHIVVCDFTGKNPNVFYEAGIAHTLGKHVVPITQAAADIPFDLQHHRYLQYLNNGEGLAALNTGLAQRFIALRS